MQASGGMAGRNKQESYDLISFSPAQPQNQPQQNFDPFNPRNNPAEQQPKANQNPFDFDWSNQIGKDQNVKQQLAASSKIADPDSDCDLELDSDNEEEKKMPARNHGIAAARSQQNLPHH